MVRCRPGGGGRPVPALQAGRQGRAAGRAARDAPASGGRGEAAGGSRGGGGRGPPPRSRLRQAEPRRRGAGGGGAAAVRGPDGAAALPAGQSQSAFGKGLLELLSRDRLDDDVWDEIEETPDHRRRRASAPTQVMVEGLRTRVKVLGSRTPAGGARAAARGAAHPDRSRPGPHAARAPSTASGPRWCWSWASTAPARPPPPASSPASLIGDGKKVVLGAADTFRAAAADQLQTWGDAGGRRRGARPGGRRPGVGGLRRRRPGASRRRSTWSSSTPRAACTPRPA